MSIPEQYRGRYFYHFIHMDNLIKIVAEDYLTLDNDFDGQFYILPTLNKQNRKDPGTIPVNCPPYGQVKEYISFYFASLVPPLLKLIKTRGVNQKDLLFLAVPMDKMREEQVVFTEESLYPLADTPASIKFYKDPKELEKLDWAAIDGYHLDFSNNRNRRLAEVLIYKKVPLHWIDHIVVWDEAHGERVKQIFARKDGDLESMPRIVFDHDQGRHFYFKKFMAPDRKEESLVTDAEELRQIYLHVVEDIIEKRRLVEDDALKTSTSQPSYPFDNLGDALDKLEQDFCSIDELKGIYQLETKNKSHRDNVSDHTLKVVQHVSKNEFYDLLSREDQDIVKISAYLHDIGKGPKSMWPDGIQRVYADHPLDGLRMLKRILVEDFKDLSDYAVQKICLLVAYHDLVGDMMVAGRQKEELYALHMDRNDLHMLICLTLADVTSINPKWEKNITSNLPALFQDFDRHLF